MNKVYACSDLHGQYGLWCQIKEYCDENDVIIYLGDAVDRGTDNLQTLIELLKDERVIFLKGNHEDIMYNMGKKLIDANSRLNISELRSWFSNGGKDTIESLQALDKKTVNWLFSKIEDMPHKIIYTNTANQTIHLSHAGESLDFSANLVEYLWDRHHISDKWDEEKHPNDIIVHGHTPVFSLLYPTEANNIITPIEEDSFPTIIKYANGHKIDIDLGAFFSQKTAILNLDTLEPIYFEEKEEMVKENE